MQTNFAVPYNESNNFSSDIKQEIKAELSDDNVDQNKKSQCSTCGQKFRFLKALQKHEARHQGDGGFICKSCGMRFTTAEAREKHRDKIHKVLRCKICNIRFITESEYLHHINSLHNGRDCELSICSVCGKQFKTKGELTHHVASKCGTIKKYQCAVCFQTLMTPGSLHNHMLRHTGQRTFMCRFCAKTFLTAGQLTVHERIHTQEKAFKCEICNKGFCHRQSLITHSTLHTGIKPYQCEGCGNSFSCVGNLLKHRRTHSDSCGTIPSTAHRVKHPATKLKVQVNTPVTAKLRTLEKRKRLEQISAQINNELKWQKDSANSFQDSLDQQVNENGVDNGFSVPEEDIKIPENNDNRSLLNIHSDNMCLTEESHVKLDNEEQRNFAALVPCQKFEYDANNFNYLENPVKNENELFDIKSEDQNFFSQTQENLEESVDNENWPEDLPSNNDYSSDDSVDLETRILKYKLNKRKRKRKVRKKRTIDKDELRRFVEERGFDEMKGLDCKYCGSHYSVPLWLLKHEQKHEETLKNGDSKGAFKCSCCTESFNSKEECINHQQCKHVDELNCKECDRIFANPDSLKAHQNFYHLGVPRKRYIYVCEKCGRVFKQKALLVAHEQGACGSGPMFPCRECGKAFSSKHVLKSHKRVHEPEKSLLCKFCGKSFHWKGQLKIHERSHTGETPFKCQFCPKAFAYRESLITHNTLHTGIKPHLCEACGSRFSCIGNLLKHRRTHANTCGVVTQRRLKL